jgi:protein TonB
METEVLVARNWDDVVFENRHKNYGAYFIRKSYDKSMIAGLGVSVLIACVLIALPSILSLFSIKIEGGTPVIDKKDDRVIFDPEPRIEYPKLQPEAPKPPPRQTTAAGIQVTMKETETVVTDNVDIVKPSSTDGDGPPVQIVGPTIVDAPEPAPEPPVHLDPLPRAEVMPMFENMSRFFSRNLKYPSAARHLRVTGKVFVGFVVNKEGKVVDVKLLRGIHPDCDKEAIRVVSMMPDWTPGMQNEQAVAVRMVLPIKFDMPE